VTREDRPPAIEVYCDDESTRSGMHGGRIAKVVTFQRADGRWVVLRPEKWSDPPADERERYVMEHIGQPFDDDAYLAHMEGLFGKGFDVAKQTDRRDARGEPARFDDRFAHTTYKLRCPLCGLDQQRHHEAAAPVLDRLFAAGVLRISLVQLSAMLGQ
jgi:hypothetical protein